MKVVTFCARSAADAVAQVRAQLGPEAIVLNVRRLPADGLARLWQKPRIEVLACLPEEKTQTVDSLAELRQEIAQLKGQLSVIPHPLVIGKEPEPRDSLRSSEAESEWHIASVLEQMGILPLYAQKVIDALHARYGDNPPESLGEELGLTRALLTEFWRPLREQGRSSPFHLFVGPPGVGKTTILCKWLTQSVLLEGHSAHVWRLDGQSANTAESLSVYGDILAVPVDRTWLDPQSVSDSEIFFVDLPGVDWTHALAVEDFKRQISSLPNPQIHLVLNAAYEVPLLLAQIRAFASLPLVDLSFTHLDEETRWGKLWNFVLGTNYSIRFLSSGQNIPGNFQLASVDRLLLRQVSG